MIRTARSTSILVLLLLLLGITAGNAASRDPDTHFFNDSFGNLKEELETAQDEGKKGVMLFFEMDECPFCDRMKATVFNQSKVQDYFRENFRIIKVDIGGDVELSDFSGNTTTQKDFAFQQHRVRATPVIVFFDLEGKETTKYTGTTGDADEFMLLGKFVAEGHYKTTKFTKFKRESR